MEYLKILLIKWIKALIGINYYLFLKRFFFYNKKDIAQKKAFYGSFINEKTLCYDVGANIGDRTAIFLSLGANVVAIEPQKECVRVLKKKFKDAVTIVPYGLTDTPSVKILYLTEETTLASFSREWIEKVKEKRFEEYEWQSSEQVQMTTLDALINQYGIPHFIKIDVEGYELQVLKGLSQPINMISFEYTVPESTQKAIECLEKLESLSLNYKCNYSKQEMMKWEMNTWLTIQDMKNRVLNTAFTSTSNGDIYVKIF